MEPGKQLPGRSSAHFVATPRGCPEILECAIQDILDRAREDDEVIDGYVHRGADRVDATKLDIKAIAFYIPHFYPGCPEGDQWSKVVMAVPRYLGQYQPHFPGELGFYDLRLADVMRQQIDLARQYGIFGSSLHFDQWKTVAHCGGQCSGRCRANGTALAGTRCSNGYVWAVSCDCKLV